MLRSLFAGGSEYSGVNSEVLIASGCCIPFIVRRGSPGSDSPGVLVHELLGPTYANGGEALDMGMKLQKILL